MVAILAVTERELMGYDIHITRKEDWFDKDGPEIELDEWADIVDSDDDLEWDEPNGPDAVIWRGEPGTSFWYKDGIISTKDPSRESIKKMFEIAIALDAVVQGDNGEPYDACGVQKGLTEEQMKPPHIVRKPMSRWRKLLRKLLSKN